MNRSRIISVALMGMFLVGCDSQSAEDAAQRASASSESQGFGSEAFRERHADLVTKFEEKGHPVFDEHPALRVHRALVTGEHPKEKRVDPPVGAGPGRR